MAAEEVDHQALGVGALGVDVAEVGKVGLAAEPEALEAPLRRAGLIVEIADVQVLVQPILQ